MSIDMSWLLIKALAETLYMVSIAGLIGIAGGIPLGVLLYTTRAQGVLANRPLNQVTAIVVNTIRSIPFIILLVALVPLTRLIVGTSIGTTAAIVPLSIGAIPFIARIVENALNEVPHGLVESGYAMGASPSQIIFRILIPEALPGIINGITVVLISLISYSAMAGAVGGGGLGDLAIRYGYQRFNLSVMIATIIILIVLVQLLQFSGHYLARRVAKK